MNNCISDFIKSWKYIDGIDPKIPPWNIRFRNAGYYSVEATNLSQWTQVHAWCEEQFGKEHYSWSGTTFWFERSDHAMWFALKWV